MTAAEFLEIILPQWRASLPASVSHGYFDRFVARNRAALEAKFGALLDHRSQTKARPTAPTTDIDAPADQRLKSQRTRANLAAVQLVVHEATRRVHRQPSCSVLLGVQRTRRPLDRAGPGPVPTRAPARNLRPDPRVLHPHASLADAIGDLVCSLAAGPGRPRRLHPCPGAERGHRAAGAGRERLVGAWPLQGRRRRSRACSGRRSSISRVSSRLLRAVPARHDALRDAVRAVDQPGVGALPRCQFNLILSNPPYGERGGDGPRGPGRLLSRAFTAFAYFMRRALDLLVPGGVGVFLVPAGFLSSKAMRARACEKLLRRHHLAGAFRLPSHDTAGPPVRARRVRRDGPAGLAQPRRRAQRGRRRR
jgi:hypothetical protein